MLMVKCYRLEICNSYRVDLFESRYLGFIYKIEFYCLVVEEDGI